MIGRLTDEQIEEVLKSSIVGRIGCNANNKIYVVPINYIYDGKSIIGHSEEGMKIDMMRKNPSVCFEVDSIQNPTHWKSVIAWGEYRELTEEPDRYDAMKLFVNRMMNLKISESALPPEISEQRVHPRSPGNIKLVVFKIILEEKTGRHEHD